MAAPLRRVETATPAPFSGPEAVWAETRRPGSAVPPANAVAPAVAADPVLPGLPFPLVAVPDHPVPQPERRPEAGGAASGSTPGLVPAPVPGSTSSSVPASASGEGAGDPGAEPVSVMAVALPATAARGRMLLLPFSPRIGAAAWRSGGSVLLAVDSDKPIDFSALADDPDFGGAVMATMTGGALVTLPLPPARRFWVRRMPQGWGLVLDRVETDDAELRTRRDGAALRIDAAGAVRVMTVPAEAPGSVQLVGLVRADRQGMGAPHPAIGYRLRPTALGVVVDRDADDVELRAATTGFVIDGDPGTGRGSVGTGPAVVDADGLSRVLRFPDVPETELRRRYRDDLSRAAALPVARRHDARLDAAEDAFGLGLGRESAELVRVADEDAPERRKEGRDAFLRSADAVLDGDEPAAEPPDAVPDRTDESSFWRGLALSGMPDRAAEAQHLLAGRTALLRTYPAPLRRQLAGRVALAIAHGGNGRDGGTDARRAVDAIDGGGSALELARILVGSAAGGEPPPPAPNGSRSVAPHDPEQLAALERLSRDPDPAIAAEALDVLVDRRVAAGSLTPSRAAALLDEQLLTARMAGRELPELLRIATLHAAAGEWPSALAILREARARFPDRTVAVDAAAHGLAGAMAAAVRGSGADRDRAALAMLDGAEDGLDQLPDPERASLAAALSDRLRELDLSDRAVTLLNRAIGLTRDGGARAMLGEHLAVIELTRGHADAARAALNGTESATAAVDVLRERDATRAALPSPPVSAPGSGPAAVAASASASGPPARPVATDPSSPPGGSGSPPPEKLDLLLAEQAGEAVPPGPLGSAEQDRLLHLAALLSRAGRRDELSRLDARWSNRFGDPAKRDMFRLLCAPPVGALGDLDRSAADLAAARNALSVLPRPDATRSGGG